MSYRPTRSGPTGEKNGSVTLLTAIASISSLDRNSHLGLVGIEYNCPR